MSLINLVKKGKGTEIGRLKTNKTNYHVMADLQLYKPLLPRACTHTPHSTHLPNSYVRM